MAKDKPLPRRTFLKQAAGAIGAATQVGAWPALGENPHSEAAAGPAAAWKDAAFPRVFTGRKLKMIAFPLGGVAAGSVALGGRGQLRDWEMFNRPNKGYSPTYGFPSIWAQAGEAKPVARVLEARILPPYEGQDGLGANNAPGLSRLDTATFTGAYPLAHIAFEDRTLPVTVELEAFSPFIPHEPDDSGLPVAILRYRVTNPKHTSAKVSITWSLENPVKAASPSPASGQENDPRQNTYQSNARIVGLTMSNPALSESDPMRGTLALAALTQPGIRVSYWRGWPRGRWWNSPMLFWMPSPRAATWAQNPRHATRSASFCRVQPLRRVSRRHSPSYWRGTFPIAPRNGAAGKRRRVREVRASATTTRPASTMRGRQQITRRSIWSRWSSVHASSPIPFGRAHSRRW